MEVILIATLLVVINYGFILLSFKFFGKVGLFICIPIILILANIQVLITIQYIGMTLTLGNIAFVSSYLITDLIGELYSKEAAKKAVFIGFMTIIMVVIIMNLILLFTPDDFGTESFASIANIFKLLPRVLLASLLAFFVSQYADVIIFAKFKEKSKGKKLWLRNNISTISSQVLDGIIFTFAAFYGVFPLEIVLEIFITTYIIKTIIAICDTPFMYLGVWMYKNNHISEI